MKYIFTFLILLLSLFVSGQRGYHIMTTPGANDNNVGTLASPFRNLSKISNIGLQPGDTVWIHTGTYLTTAALSSSTFLSFANINGNAANPIRIWAWPGDEPVFSLSNVGIPSASDPTALVISNCNYIHIKNLRIAYLQQNHGGNGISRGVQLNNLKNSTLELLEVDHIGGYGIMFGNGTNDNLILNCDIHHCEDRFSQPDPFGGANGIDISGRVNATRNTFTGCRAWFISDDGFDFFRTDGYNTLNNCWSFFNGYDSVFNPTGDGYGYKLGPDSTYSCDQPGCSDNPPYPHTASHNRLLRVLNYCLAFGNKTGGFSQNVGDMRYQLTNCTAYGNGTWGFIWDYVTPDPTCYFSNNLSFNQTNAYRGSEILGTKNTWTPGVPFTVSNADFLSISSLGMDGPRQADGSLPYLNFLRLAPTSDLINAGVAVTTPTSVPFIPPTPDIGAFEYVATLTVSAGSDKVTVLPTQTTTLNGSGSGSATPLSFEWTQISGGSATITNPTSPTTSVTILTAGVRVFRLTITDNTGLTASDDVQVTVNAAPATAPSCSGNTTANITLPVNSAALTVTASSTDGGTISSYSWVKTSGPATGSITNATTANATAINLVAGTYVFTVTVTASNALTCTKTTTVTVNPAVVAPSVVTGANIIIQLPTNSTTLTSTPNGGSGTITNILWTKISGPATFNIVTPTTQNTTFNNLVQGIYQIKVVVTASTGLTAADTISVSVLPAANVPPVANCSGSQTIQLPISNATISVNATDADGSIVAYQWVQRSGPAATISNATSPTTSILGLTQGVSVFGVTVRDNSGDTTSCTVQITVNAAPATAPSCVAGGTSTITLPVNSAAIGMTANSTDGGTISSYSWAKISGPATFTIVNGNTTNATATNLVAGTYLFRGTATANNALTCTTDRTVIVNPIVTPPTVVCGSDISIQLPTSSTTLTSTINAGSGSISSILWSRVSGPVTFTLTTPTAQNTGVTGLVAGIYRFKVAVVGTTGNAADTMTVTVLPAANVPPVPTCGSNQTITLPVTTSTISVTATDSDGTITGYTWIQTGGTAATISNPTSQTTTIIGLTTAGVRTFQVTIRDNNGATASCNVTVTVNAATPVAPIANAGANRSVTLPVNFVNLLGSGSTTDGSTITGYLWSKIAGPATFNIVAPTNPTTQINNLVSGTYQLELRVQSSNGLFGRDSMLIVVEEAPLVPPNVQAGANMTITLPTTFTVLIGTAVAASGTIASVQWTQLTGPVTATLGTPTSLTTNVTNLTTAGVYTFELRGTDSNGLIGRDTTTVTVNPANGTRTNFIFFDGVVTPQKKVQLKWAANVTPNTSLFTLYRKVLIWYLEIAKINPKIGQLEYSYIDSNAPNGTLYYRATVKDKDGKTNSRDLQLKKK